MPMHLEGSCRCGAISFSVDSHTPYPYQRCYCSICRKSAGGGGYAINIMGLADTLKVKGKTALGVWNAPIDGHKGSADRHYCKRCGTPLWVRDEQWPELVHPFASAIDTELPKSPSSVLCCCATKRAGSSRRSAPMTTASTAIPNCRSRTGTKNTGCGSNDGVPPGKTARRAVIAREVRAKSEARRSPFEPASGYHTTLPLPSLGFGKAPFT
jgi:hypothetical protein